MAIVKTTASGGNLPEKNNNKPAAKPNLAKTRAPLGARPGATPADSKSFLQDTRAELHKVVWPSREQRRSGVVVTIGLLVFCALYILGVDKIIEQLFKALGLYS